MAVDPQIVAAEEVDAWWLTEIMHAAGVGREAEIVGLVPTSIGTGQVGENVRFELTWSDREGDLPLSVVGKFPSPSETSRAAAVATRTYEREVGFYRDMAHKTTIRTPEMFHVAGDLEANTFTLIMADLAPAKVGDQLSGCSVAEARLAVAGAADLHGSTWDTVADLEQLGWTDTQDDRTQSLSAIYDRLFDGFVERYSPQLTEEALGWGRWIRANMARVRDHSIAGCLVHGDFRLDNMMFGAESHERQLTVVDWQTANIGVGPVDLAYFIGAGLLPEVRRRHERDLFSHYVQRLRRYDVRESADELWRSYRLGSTSGYIMAVVASQLVQQTERGDAMFCAMASRHALQMSDLELQ